MSHAAAVPRWRADLALGGIALIWGSSFVIVKQALADVSTLLFLAARLSLAAVALALAFRLHYPGSRSAREVLPGGLIAGLCLFSGFALQTFGLRYTTPSKSAFITGLSVVMVPVLGAMVARAFPQVSEWLGVVVATLGMGLLTLQGDSLWIGLGDLLTLGCAVAFATHIQVVGHYSRKIGFEGLSLVQTATAALIALGTFWWIEPPRVRWTSGLVIALLVTGLLATALAFTVQAWAQRHTTATRTALIFALEPVFAWLTSYIVSGETLSPRGVTGAVLILGGILLAELKPVRLRGHQK